MQSALPSLVALGLAALAAAALALSRPSPASAAAERAAASRALLVALVLQGLHFGEEWATGFAERFPALFGPAALPAWLFAGFNLAWFGLWAASVPGLRAGRAWALFAAWFLAIAGTLNGLAHPLLAVAAGGYFPGLFSAPLVGVASFLLGRCLGDATRPG